MTISEIEIKYKEYDKEIVDYMTSLCNALQTKYGEIPDEFVISLDLLAMNLEILLTAKREMKEKGMTDTDKYRGEKKSSAAQAFWNAQNYIHRIIASFGFTPSSKSKIRENQSDADVQKLIETLSQ